jgi:hypothetical protein
MTTLESRHLGSITLDGGSGGGAMNAEVSFSGTSLPVRIEIDYPDRFGESVVHDIDMVLDNLEFVDGLARDTIVAGLPRDDSASAQLFRAWAQRGPGRDGATAEFLRELRPTQILILPDGGTANRDRVVITYALADSTADGKITVRFLDPTGPELAPAPRTAVN